MKLLRKQKPGNLLLGALFLAAAVSFHMAAPASAEPPAWYNNGWQNRLKLTVPESGVAGESELRDFPVCLDMSVLPAQFFSGVKNDGGDIRITAGDGTSELPVEIVSVDRGARQGEMHFRGNLYHGKDSVFYLYYGNPAAEGYPPEAPFGAHNVWTNGFIGVWHMNDLDDFHVEDSTRGKVSGVKFAPGNPEETEGIIGRAQNFAERASSIEFGDRFDIGTSSFTLEAWVNMKELPGIGGLEVDPGERRPLFGKRSGGRFGRENIPGYFIFLEEDMACILLQDIEDNFVYYRADHEWVKNEWYHIVYSINRGDSTLRVYVNGSEAGSANISRLGEISNDNIFRVGAFGQGTVSNHLMDEVRLSSVARGRDWIKTGYNNQADPAAFIKTGEEERPSAPARRRRRI